MKNNFYKKANSIFLFAFILKSKIQKNYLDKIKKIIIFIKIFIYYEF